MSKMKNNSNINHKKVLLESTNHKKERKKRGIIDSTFTRTLKYFIPFKKGNLDYP